MTEAPEPIAPPPRSARAAFRLHFASPHRSTADRFPAPGTSDHGLVAPEPMPNRIPPPPISHHGGRRGFIDSRWAMFLALGVVVAALATLFGTRHVARLLHSAHAQVSIPRDAAPATNLWQEQIPAYFIGIPCDWIRAAMADTKDRITIELRAPADHASVALASNALLQAAGISATFHRDSPPAWTPPDRWLPATLFLAVLLLWAVLGTLVRLAFLETGTSAANPTHGGELVFGIIMVAALVLILSSRSGQRLSGAIPEPNSRSGIPTPHPGVDHLASVPGLEVVPGTNGRHMVVWPSLGTPGEIHHSADTIPAHASLLAAFQPEATYIILTSAPLAAPSIGSERRVDSAGALSVPS